MIMDEFLKTPLQWLECQIKEACLASDSYEQYRRVKDMSGTEKQMLEALLRERKQLLDSMFLGTPAEVARLKEVNDRLYDLTQKLYVKTYDLYTARLRTGYDSEFDDDIMFEGTLFFDADGWEDDGVSWDHRKRFPEICLCHAAYSLLSDNLFSWPDLLRMNDFWCEVKVTHQLLTDLSGKRYSCIAIRNS